MSEALNKVINKAVVSVVKNTSKLELAVDRILEKFKDSCPPKPELLKIVQQKNQLQDGLNQILDTFSSVQEATDSTNVVIDTLSTAVQTIKLIPIPTAIIPPSGGVGIAINVLTKLADSLDILGDVLKGAKGATGQVGAVSNTVSGAVGRAVSQLGKLDFLIDKCIGELAEKEDMNQQEKNALIAEVGNAAATAGTFANPNLNILNEESLISQLQPGSNPPFLYAKKGAASRDWLLILEEDANNQFSFPSRRIKATNINEDAATNPFIGYITYNNKFQKSYSYTSSVKTLLDEMKATIDSLNIRWAEQNNEAYDPQDEAENDTSGRDKLTIPLDLLEIPIKNNQPIFKFGTITKNATNQKLQLVINTGFKNGTFNTGAEYRVAVSSVKSGSTETPRVNTYFVKDKKVERSVFLFTPGEPSIGDYQVTISITDTRNVTNNVTNARVQLRTLVV
jgi:hypothetical protein